MILRTWYITTARDWDAYFAEVTALSRGRMDLRIACHEPGVISLVQK